MENPVLHQWNWLLHWDIQERIRLYNRHKDEFSDDMTIIISENPKSGVSGNLKTGIFPHVAAI